MLSNCCRNQLVLSFFCLFLTLPALALEFTDFQNKKISLPVLPKKIAALIPSLAEAVFELESGDKVLAAPLFTTIPEALKSKIKNLGPYHKISAEVVYDLNADLILANRDGNDPALVKNLERLGLKVAVLDTSSLENILNSLKILAQILGKERNTPFITQLESALTNGIMAKSKNKKIFFQLGWNPIVSVSKQNFIGELLERVGFVNVLAYSKIKYPRPAIEEVLKQNPDIILICSLTDDTKEGEAAQKFWRSFPQLAATQANQIKIVSGHLVAKPGFNLIKGLEFLRSL